MGTAIDFCQAKGTARHTNRAGPSAPVCFIAEGGLPARESLGGLAPGFGFSLEAPPVDSFTAKGEAQL